MAAADPLAAGRPCDFCSWRELTAADTWGRVEGPHAVSASNLFKYIAPAQGEGFRVRGEGLSSEPVVCRLGATC